MALKWSLVFRRYNIPSERRWEYVSFVNCGSMLMCARRWIQPRSFIKWIWGTLCLLFSLTYGASCFLLLFRNFLRNFGACTLLLSRRLLRPKRNGHFRAEKKSKLSKLYKNLHSELRSTVRIRSELGTDRKQ